MSALVEWRVTCTPGEARCAPLALARSVENLYEQYTVRAAVESKARCASAERAARSGPGKERPGRGPPRRAACEGRAGAAVPACVPTERTMPPGSPPPIRRRCAWSTLPSGWPASSSSGCAPTRTSRPSSPASRCARALILALAPTLALALILIPNPHPSRSPSPSPSLTPLPHPLPSPGPGPSPGPSPGPMPLPQGALLLLTAAAAVLYHARMPAAPSFEQRCVGLLCATLPLIDDPSAATIALAPRRAHSWPPHSWPRPSAASSHAPEAQGSLPRGAATAQPRACRARSGRNGRNGRAAHGAPWHHLIRCPRGWRRSPRRSRSSAAGAACSSSGSCRWARRGLGLALGLRLGSTP